MKVIRIILSWAGVLVLLGFIAITPLFILSYWNDWQETKAYREEVVASLISRHNEIIKLTQEVDLDGELFSSTIIKQYQNIERLRFINGWNYESMNAGYLISEYYISIMFDMRNIIYLSRDESPEIRAVRFKSPLSYFNAPFNWMIAE